MIKYFIIFLLIPSTVFACPFNEWNDDHPVCDCWQLAVEESRDQRYSTVISKFEQMLLDGECVTVEEEIESDENQLQLFIVE